MFIKVNILFTSDQCNHEKLYCNIYSYLLEFQWTKIKETSGPVWIKKKTLPI